MDSELFELCKEVYKRFPEWQIEHERFFADSMGEIELLYAAEILPPDFIICPLYTSDYLLEKLLPHTSISLFKSADGYIDIQYDAERPDYNDYSSSDIRITLLKLVIALDEGGVRL